MRIPGPLLPGRLVQRYKRFLADIRLESGAIVTVHCANSGSMKGLLDPGSRVLISESSNPARKLRYTWELIKCGRSWVGINTILKFSFTGQEFVRRTSLWTGSYRIRSEIDRKSQIANHIFMKIGKTAKKRPDSRNDQYWISVFQIQDSSFLYHPNRATYLRDKVRQLCRKRLSTRMVEFLHKLYEATDDVLIRGPLAKKDLTLRRGYLESHKEYSDRALQRLVERENLFDKWEGIYILGCFGTRRAVRYLRDLLTQENDPLLHRAIKRSIEKIETNTRKKREKRGF